MNKIFLVTYGGGHMKIIEPIAKELLKDKNIEVKILALTSAYKYLVNSFTDDIVKKISDYSFLFDDIIDEVFTLGLELLEDNYTPNTIVSKEETIYYIGLSFYDLIKRIGKNEAYKKYNEKKRQAFLPISIMETILKHEKPDTVVSTTAPRFEQASFMAANNLNIKTIEILDLFGELYPLPEAKHIVCMNESIKESLINQGLKDRKYYFLGQPAIENSVNEILSLNKENIYNKINVNKGNITLLYASQTPILHNQDCTYNSMISYDLINKKIFKILEKINNKFSINITFRIHPNEDIKDYLVYFKKYSFVKFINNTLNLYESIALADVIITPYSTVAVESIGASKITFTYKNDLSFCYPVKEMKKKPFIFSNGFEELENNLFKYLDNPKKMDSIDDFLPKNSVQNIIKLIKEL